MFRCTMCEREQREKRNGEGERAGIHKEIGKEKGREGTIPAVV